ncbi:MAG: hypothetical protein ACLR23_10035 [Clostridia bacterium]
MNKKKFRQIWGHWQLYVMVLPALVWLLLFAYKPMYGLIIAFKDFSFRAGIWGSKWVGVQHFQRLFSSYWLPIILKNTLTLSLLSLVFDFRCQFFFALMVNEIRNKKVQSLDPDGVLCPHFISTIVVCGLLLLILSPEGIINLFLNFLERIPYTLSKSRTCSNGFMS